MKLGPGVLALGVCMAAQAAPPLEVSVLNSQYTTYVFVQTNGFNANVDSSSSGNFEIWSPGNSRMMGSPVSISDSLYLDGTGILAAEANADMFGVSAFTDMHQAFFQGWPGHNSTAGAESVISFLPLTGGTATTDLEFTADYDWSYSAGSVSLFDVTSNQTLWNYGWYLSSASLPWTGYPGGPASAILSVETDFNAADTYSLTIYTQTYADQDNEQTSIQLSGFEIVPEPSAFALIGLGTAAALILRRRCRAC